MADQELAGRGRREPVPIEFRDIDYEDTVRVDEFCENGCGCSTNCAMQFSMKQYLITCSNAQQMHRKNLDMALMGQVMAFTFCSDVPQNTTKQTPDKAEREKHGHLFPQWPSCVQENLLVSSQHLPESQ